MSRVSFDLDGVLYNFGSAVEHYLDISRTPLAELLRAKINDHVGGESWPAPATWDWYEDQWGLSHAEFKAVCDEGVDEGIIFAWGEPERGAKEAIDSLRDAGHDIVFVTARNFGTIPGAMETATYRWLETYGLFVAGIDSLHFDADKTGFGLDYMLEDNLENLAVLAADATVAVRMARPWNRRGDVSYPVAYKMEDYPNIIAAMEGMKTFTPRYIMGIDYAGGPAVPIALGTGDAELDRLLAEETEIERDSCVYLNDMERHEFGGPTDLDNALYFTHGAAR